MMRFVLVVMFIKKGITKKATPISITSTPMYFANSFMW